jgi:S-adenosylmethionine synthetase
VVERKGIGHPDTVADGIAELASIRYTEYCLAHFGAVCHHNLDKVAVFGGRARFGAADGQYERPVRVIIGGRASTSFAGEPIPVTDLLTAAAHEQLRLALPGYDQTLIDVRVETTDTSKFPHWFAPRGLHDLPERTRVRSNDTAFLVGVWPRTAAEVTALATEAWLNAQPWSGSDIKVLVIRHHRRLDVTACVPALAGQVDSSAQFRHLLADAEKTLTRMVGELVATGGAEFAVDVRCNTKEDPASGDKPLSSQYFTVSGSALDYGEDGLVGRGNARHGLISPNHLAGNEITYGKNPAYHVGKVGAWLADQSAAALYQHAGPCRIGLVWRIGADYADPAALHITTSTSGPADPDLHDLALACLAERAWLADLVTGQRYRPRVASQAALAAPARAPR